MNEIKLIADSGATHTKWALINGSKTDLFQSQGIAPYLMEEATIEEIISKEVLPKLDSSSIQKIYYYGTGCKNQSNAEKLKRVLSKLFSGEIFVHHDLMGAARGTCGDQPGIVCILGTGSNSCFYDGNEIVKNSPGLGFILGDEGGGTYFGKEIVRHLLYEKWNQELASIFYKTFDTSPEKIIETVYRKPLPNRYLAGFTTFLETHRGNDQVEALIKKGLSEFFENHIIRYPESSNVPIHFVGGVAIGFKDVVEQLCEKYKLHFGSATSNPLAGLIHYHSIH